MPDHLTAAQCTAVLAVTPEQIENSLLALAGIGQQQQNLSDEDKAFVLRELRLTLDTALKEWKEKEAEVMARVTPALDADYIVNTKTQDGLNLAAVREEQPDFWENYSYIPADIAQRMEGRLNQRDALRALYHVDRLPDEVVRVQDVKDFLPMREAESLLIRDAKLLAKAVLLVRDGAIYGHTV